MKVIPKRRLTRPERRKYLACYVGLISMSLFAHDSRAWWLGFLGGMLVEKAEGMYRRARTRRYFRNQHGAVLTVTGSDPTLASKMADDASFTEISPKDVA